MTPQTPVSGVAVALTICRRELIRFFRQPARIAAAIGTPMLLWVLLTSGFGDSLVRDSLGASYASFLLPGVMSLVAVFAAIFSSISVIEDRREGWLQSVLVSPAPRWSIALGKMLGGGVMAFVQAAMLLLALLLLDVQPGIVGIAWSLLGIATLSFSMAGLGLMFAWRCETTASFHAVMNLVFMPMWMLSGAFFPVSGAHAWMAWLIRINPLTWATEAVRGPLTGLPASDWSGAMTISVIFAIGMLGLATWIVTKPSKSS